MSGALHLHQPSRISTRLAEWDALVRFEIIELSSLIIIDYHAAIAEELKA